MWENIIFPVAMDGKKPDKKFVMQVVKLLGLEKRLDSMPNQLSGGQQQRIALARAIVTNSKTSDDVIGLLKMTGKEFHQTIVMITHNPEIAQMADCIVRIEDGKIVQQQGRIL